MTEGGEKITRRDALKKAAQYVGGLFVVGAVPEKLIKESNKEEPKFVDINEEFELTLFQGNSAESIQLHIDSFGIDRPPKLRSENGTFVAKEFKDKTETVRMLGEITDFRLFKVGINTDMIKDGIVKTYRSPIGFLKGDSGGNLPNNEDFYALKEIDGPCNYFQGTTMPEEKNRNTNPTDPWMDVNSFGNGFLVGKLKQENGKNILYDVCHVCDARALKTTN